MHGYSIFVSPWGVCVNYDWIGSKVAGPNIGEFFGFLILFGGKWDFPANRRRAPIWSSLILRPAWSNRPKLEAISQSISSLAVCNMLFAGANFNEVLLFERAPTDSFDSIVCILPGRNWCSLLKILRANFVMVIENNQDCVHFSA